MLKSLGLVCCLGCTAAISNCWGQTNDRLQLTLKPRLCTLAKNETHCDANIDIQWASEQIEDLCLGIVQFPEVRKCWESAKKGGHSVELVFDTDLEVFLKDSHSQQQLVSRTLKIIREAIRYRRKRRQPWNIFS